MADNSILEIALDADDNIWWMIIDTTNSWSLVLLACEKSAIASILAYRHLELDETMPWNLELSSGSVLNVSCML